MAEPITLAGGVLLNPDREMLLLHRSTEVLTQWEMPGGESEAGECPEATMRRELRKETGVRIETAKFLAKTSFTQAGILYESHWFEVTSPDRPRIMEPELHDELKYYAPFRLRRMMDVLSPNMQKFTKQLTDGEIRLGP